MNPRWLGLVPVAALLGLLWGRHHGPERTRDVVKTDVVYKDRIVEKVVHDVAVQRDTDEKVHTVVVTKWLKEPTGAVSVVQESRQERDTATETKRQDHAHGTQERQSEAHQATVEMHTTESRPNWSVSVLAGAQLGGRNLLVPAPFVGGVHIQRRLVGPVSVGVWGTTGMAGGISLRLDF